MTFTEVKTLQLDYVRQQFPALAGDWIFFDNAGGSQTLKRVVDRIGEYLLTSNVQLGASYAISQLSGDRVLQARQAVATFLNAAVDPEVVIGPSTSMLLRILSLGLAQTFRPGDEVIVTNTDHEANVSPWTDLKRQGITVKIWRANPESLQLRLEDLELLMGPRTRLVAVTHVSNILGTLNPIQQIARFVHSRGALICVDGVGYAAHRLIDVQDLEVDFYAFSSYKVYGPHIAVLYGKQEHLLRIPGLNHYFIEETEIPYKFQPGNVNYELSYSLLGVNDYLSSLTKQHYGSLSATSLRGQLAQAFALIALHEEELADRLLTYLNGKPNVRIIGHLTADRHKRVPTISFVVEGVDSASIPPKIDPHRIGIRYGDFYAKKLIQDLGLIKQNGVVRVSMVHYNTPAEVDRLIDCFERVL